MFSHFYPGFIQPHAVLLHNSTLTTEAFGSLILFFFFSLRSYFAVLFSHHLFPVWKEALRVCFGPGGVLAQNTASCYGWETEPDSPLEFTPTASVHPWAPFSPPSSLPYLPPSMLLFIPLLHLSPPPRPLPALCPSPLSLPLSDLQQTYGSSTANPTETTTIFMTYYTLPVNVFMSFILGVGFGTSRPHVKLSSPTVVDAVEEVAIFNIFMNVWTRSTH